MLFVKFITEAKDFCVFFDGSYKKKLNSNDYEIYGFCSKLNNSVIGGLSKLLSYFIKNYNFKNIISYVDLSYFSGSSYIKNGFKFDKKIGTKYNYIINNKRYYNDNIDKEMIKNKYKIYNSGGYNLKYEK